MFRPETTLHFVETPYYPSWTAGGSYLCTLLYLQCYPCFYVDRQPFWALECVTMSRSLDPSLYVYQWRVLWATIHSAMITASAWCVQQSSLLAADTFNLYLYVSASLKQQNFVETCTDSTTWMRTGCTQTTLLVLIIRLSSIQKSTTGTD